MQRLFVLLCFAVVVLFGVGFTPANADPVQVFILAGQSNMCGHGKVEMGLNPDYDWDQPNSADNPREVRGGIGCLRYMVGQDPDTFGHGGTTPLVDADGEWRVREDVSIYGHVNNSIEVGGLAPGVGGKGSWFGPEYGFGFVVGDAIGQDVVIIKVARGGTSLGGNWRPPSVVAEHGGELGGMWTQMDEDVDEALSNFGTHFPQHAGREIEIVGFGWHQGWNDRVSRDFREEYERNLVALIGDVRELFEEPELPIVIATTSMAPGDERSLVEVAQMAVADAQRYPQFAGTVATVDTRPFWRDQTQSPSGFGYHWNHNGVTHWEIGTAMGRAMLELLPDQGGAE